MAPTPGFLFVRMNPHQDLTPEEFHDWYNNEHGPMRLRLRCIENGFRYRALDVSETKFSRYEPKDLNPSEKKIAESNLPSPQKTKAEWLAVYDIDDMAGLEENEYLRLRSPPWKSQREISVMSRIDVDRRLYDHIYTTKADNFQPLDSIPEPEQHSNILIVVSRTIAISKLTELVQWYKDVRIPFIRKENNWTRTRIYRTSATESSQETTEVVVTHDFTSDGPQSDLKPNAERSTSGDIEWEKSSSETVDLRSYELYYTFGPAPRHLNATAPGYQHPVEGTKTTSTQAGGGRSNVDSYVTTADGVRLQYFLEGAVEPDAPLIVLSNSVLVDWHIWDDFIDDFLSREQNKKYRVLRYQTRGRTTDYGTQNVTVDLLAHDILTILDHLRVQKAAALVGVSLGGATVLNFALRNPERLEAVISCDTNSSSPPGNSKLWLERIAVAEEENASSTNSSGEQEHIIGEKLAELTVRRWAVPESYDGGRVESKIQKVKEGVIQNSLDGFKAVVQALWDYDLRPRMKTAAVRAIFVVGGGDGKLPTSMKDMAKDYGTGAEFQIIEGAGHLPMVEKPQEFASVCTSFLTPS